jgi:diadenosine tetraphosphate (Ap4A) HIT family hydrolase
MTDLSWPDRTILMNAVWQVEQAVRDVMQPDKVNVASLGNVVPHLHWHVIPRYNDDAHFPGPIWGAAHRTPDLATLAERVTLLPALRDALTRLLSA